MIFNQKNSSMLASGADGNVDLALAEYSKHEQKQN